MNMDMDMDMELASIVSSLSALSNSNNNGGQAAAAGIVSGGAAESQQIGGFRRSSFTTANEVDSEILLLHGSSESSPIFKKTALSVGTAPPFSTNSKKFFGNGGNYYQYRSTDTASCHPHRTITIILIILRVISGKTTRSTIFWASIQLPLLVPFTTMAMTTTTLVGKGFLRSSENL